MSIKLLEQCLAHSRYLISISYYYSKVFIVESTIYIYNVYMHTLHTTIYTIYKYTVNKKDFI